jgi:tRNA pseudouridine55 synthase
LARKKKGRKINGILLLDKEKGISSNFALQQVKRLYFAQKAGHTGSLDPLATGILPICLGEATKFAKYLLADDKTYLTVAKLGATTTTLDSEGEITSKNSTDGINLEIIKKVVENFRGEIEQIPPMYSALKKDGVPLYKLARDGIEIERKPRKITIFDLQIIDFKDDLLTLKVHCSKGTYIRTLVDDIGKELGCGAYVDELRRVGFTHFDIDKSIKFDELSRDDNFENLDNKLLNIDEILPNFDSVYLDENQNIDISFGRKITLNENQLDNKTNLVKIFYADNFLGIGEVGNIEISKVENKTLQPKRLINN